MRRGTEFATWLAARWPALVRTLVFLGHPQSEAEQVAREAVARVLPAWERERRDGDVDLLAYRSLLEERGRVRRRRDEPGGPPPEEPELPPGLADRLERRRELEAYLATLPEQERVRTVLVHVAGLADHEVDDVVEAPGPTPPLPFGATDVRDACEAVPVPPAPVAGVLARSRSRRRTAWTRGAAVVGVVAVVLAATTWWTSGDGGSEQGAVTTATNPMPIPWYADGVLHLARVEVEASDVQTLLTVPDGVVYGDDEGRVVHVDDSGQQREIGETVPGSRLVVEPDNGWVAWADPGDGDPELVVHDTLARAEVGRRSLTAPGDSGGQPVGDDGPIAIDDERIFYSSPDGDFAWEPLIDVSFALSGTMVDTAEESRVTLADGVLRVTPLPYRTGVAIDADDARLTHDGRYAFAVRESQFDVLEIYDVESGRPAPQMYSPSDHAVAWSYTDGTFYFAVLHMLQDKTYQDMLQMPSEGDYRLYECRPDREPEPCVKLAEVPEEVPAPVFPG
ncbi:hypothetical protein [Nocardioides sp. GXQ0305]|uniref:hypothetical protein n=1 Tax=Nocardioides sp. GXQ0305 TaxID=3423912 RepID=UPI003D7CE152